MQARMRRNGRPNSKSGGIFMKRILFAGIGTLAALLAGCHSSTSEIAAVTGFDPAKYMGTWYEIARLPHSFERGMDYVKAEYTQLENGLIQVVNSGVRNGEGRRIVGKAKLSDPKEIPLQGELRVSFFGPFYSDYRIIELAPDYSYAVVTGSRKNYLWILSRQPSMPEGQVKEIVGRLAGQGFDTARLEYPRQSPE